MSNSKESKSQVSCINLGYYQVKANDGICFKSMAKTTIDDNQISQGDVLKLDDMKYILEIGQPMLDPNKAISPLTKVFVLNVLAKQMGEEMTKDFNILITSPPSSYKMQREELPKFLEGDYEIEYNNKAKLVTINKVIVLPETFLIYLVNNPSKLKGKKTLIIDIGGKTTNICMLMDCKFDPESDYAFLSRGMYHINDEIASKINSKSYTTYEYDDIEFMRDNDSKTLVQNEDILNEVYTNHITEIVKKIQIKSWEIDENTNILICGGGGIVLEDSIKQVYPNAVLSNDPLFDNLKALEVMAKEIFK